ncbi:hypothetical protein FBBAL38_04635 [Flavobacteria bacterium BAL38]|nr:hypothetical protein FBBAL38_04635 [Flavobacteria bacterium BAL38]
MNFLFFVCNFFQKYSLATKNVKKIESIKL